MCFAWFTVKYAHDRLRVRTELNLDTVEGFCRAKQVYFSPALDGDGIMFWVRSERGDSDWDRDSAVRVFTSAQSLSTSMSAFARAACAVSLSLRNRFFSALS